MVFNVLILAFRGHPQRQRPFADSVEPRIGPLRGDYSFGWAKTARGVKSSASMQCGKGRQNSRTDGKEGQIPRGIDRLKRQVRDWASRQMANSDRNKQTQTKDNRRSVTD